MDQTLLEKLAIVEVVNNWAFWRDACDREIEHDLSQLEGDAVQALHAHGQRWLEGAPCTFPAGRA